jgi:hypothetical protein
VALHCSGNFAEMEDVASVAPAFSGEPARRLAAARERLRPPLPFDEARAEELLAEVLV